MPIQIQPLTDDVKTLKAAIEKIAREAQAMQNPSGQTDALFTDAVPTTDNLQEGKLLLYDDGVNRRIYTKINDTIRFVVLT